MRALTLWQPWAWCIAHADKRIENRDWKPWASVVGKRIAIHAGGVRSWDEDTADDLRFEGVQIPPKREIAFGAIVCTALLKGHISESPALGDPQRRWWAGSVGWVLADVITLPEPVPAKGAQGLWTLPPDIEALVYDQEERAALMEAR